MSTIDTTRTIEIGTSHLKMIGFLGLGAIMVAVSVAVATATMPSVLNEIVDRPIGIISTIFFGLCLLVMLWRLVAMRGPIVTLSPTGIRDSRVASEFIPWSAIEQTSVWAHRRHKFLVLAVTPAVEARLTLTRAARWSRGANRSLGGDGLYISAIELKTDFETLRAMVEAYGLASRRPRKAGD